MVVNRCMLSDPSFPADRDRNLWREDSLAASQSLRTQSAQQKFLRGCKVPVVKKQLACASAVAALLLTSFTDSSAKPFPPPSAIPAPAKAEQEPSAATTSTASLLETAVLVATSQAPGSVPFVALNRSASPLPNSEFQPAVRLHQHQPDGLTVLYAGHSFGRPFAERMAWATLLAGIDGHEQRIVSRGGEKGTPQAMWEDPAVRARIQEQLNDGAVDVVVLICCSKEFVETGFQYDQALFDIVAYALARNPETRFRFAMPWRDYPEEYASAAEHRALTDAAYPDYQLLAESVSAASGGAEVVAFYHGAAVYEIRSKYERGLIPELRDLVGSKSSSVFTDKKGHASDMTRDTGTLIWLNSIYGVNPMNLPAVNAYEVDIRAIATAALVAAP